MQWFSRLGVPATATQDQIRKAFKRLAAKKHPDVGGDAEEFRLVVGAYHEGLATFEPRDDADPGPQPRGRRGAAVYRVLEVSVFESIVGGVVMVSRTPIAYPAGVADGQKIRVAGEGERWINGGPPGELIVEVRIRPDPRWIRDDPHLIHVLPVTWLAAYRGDVVPFATPWGRRYVTIPRGSSTGDRITVPRSGVGEGGELRLVLDLIAPLPGQMDLEAALADARYPAGA